MDPLPSMLLLNDEYPRPPATSSLRLMRQRSSQKANLSSAILAAVEAGNQAEARQLLHCVQHDLIEAVLSPSMFMVYKLRTPLSAAAAAGEFALFKTVDHAVNRCIEQRPDLSREEHHLSQLDMMDADGLTLAMHAARSGNVSIFEAVLDRIDRAKVSDRLLKKDYAGKTVLMHAAGSGRAAVFVKVANSIQENFTNTELVAHLQESSDDNRTILMHAARSGDHMALSAVVHVCRRTIEPKQLRALLEKRDVEEQIFLMHAAAGCREGTAKTGSQMTQRQKKQSQEHSKQQEQPKQQKKHQQSGVGSNNDLSSSIPSADRRNSAPGRQRIISESDEKTDLNRFQEEKLSESDSGDGGVALASKMSRDDSGDDDDDKYGVDRAMMPSEARGIDDDEEAVKYSASNIGVNTQKNELVVFRVAWSLVKDTLWKQQVRGQLRARDSWGRNILIHAVLSRRLQVFDAVFYAVNEEIIGYEIEDLMGINKDDNEESIMEITLSGASKDMVRLVTRLDQQLKKTVAIREKASTIEAKIQSFIPGKSIVIFQLLLPEMNEASWALILLIFMSALAPLFSYGSSLVLKETPSSRNNLRKSISSILMSAPAMWWWGIGTSSIAQDSFGWSENSSSASLAVATILIPALDQFLSSHRMEKVYDELSCQRRRFARKAQLEWNREQGRLEAEVAKTENEGDFRRTPKIKPQSFLDRTSNPGGGNEEHTLGER